MTFVPSGFYRTAVSGALRAPAQIEQWNPLRIDPSGFKQWESGVFKAAAKGTAGDRLAADGNRGGFTAQKESGVPIDFGENIANDNGFYSNTAVVTFNLGEVNRNPDSFFDQMLEASGVQECDNVGTNFKAFNMRFWVNNLDAFRTANASGIPIMYYLTSADWRRNLTLRETTPGAQVMPSSLPPDQNWFVGDTDIFSSGAYRDSEFSHFLYMVAKFPPANYRLGTYGGSAEKNFTFRFTYDWTDIDANVRPTDSIDCSASGVTSPTPDPGPPAEAVSLNADVQVFWNLAEASGTRSDSVGSLDLTDPINSVTQNPTGGPDSGPCAVFTGGVNEYLTVNDDPILSVGARDFTWAGWFYLNDIADFHTIFGKYEATSNNREYILDTAGAQGFDDARFLSTPLGSTGGGGFDILETDDNALAAGQWYFIVVWHDEDGGSSSHNIQINNGTSYTIAKGSAIYDGSQPFQLASRADNGSNNLRGRLAKWGIWHRILTTSEKTYLYNSGAGRNHPFT